jgi:mono/diheme cytochrome c family protein
MTIASMFKALKWIGLALAIVVGVLAIYVATTWNRTWETPLPDVHASSDPAIITRGEYLVFGPAHCVECHVASSQAFERFAETKQPQPLSGGMAFPAPPLGTVYSKNLTPDRETGIGRYSDGQIARVLRYSVLPDGHTTAQPLMQYGDMSDEDLTAIVSYLRAQPPVRNVVPETEWRLSGKIARSVSPAFKPRDTVHAQTVAPPSQPTRERGEYLARSVGNCSGCHSRRNPLTLQVVGPEFSGGDPVEPRNLPDVDHAIWFLPPNLTSQPKSAVRRFPDRDTFVARFQRGGRKYPESPMPWDCFSRMTAEDVGALYEFLLALPPTGEAAPDDPRLKHTE